MTEIKNISNNNHTTDLLIRNNSYSKRLIVDDVISKFDEVLWAIELPDFKIIYVSDGALKVFGRNAQEFIEDQNLWKNILVQSDFDKVEKVFLEVYQTGKTIFDKRIIHSDGSIHWVRDRITMIYSDDGTPIRIQGISYRIDFLMELNEKLILGDNVDNSEFEDNAINISDEKLFSDNNYEIRTDINEIEDSYLLINSSYEIQEYNFKESIPYLLDFQLVEIKNLNNIFTENISKEFEANIDKVFSNGNPCNFVISLEQNDEKCKVEINICKISENNVIAVLKPVMPLNSNESNSKILSSLQNQLIILDNLNKTKTEFIENIISEIYNPFIKILNYSEILAGLNLNDAEKKYTFEIYKNSKYLLDLVDDIKDIIKIETGKFKLNDDIVSLNNLFDKLIQSLKYKILDKKLMVNISHQDGFPEFIIFDEMRLNQILNNLITNGIKFTENGSISIIPEVIYGLGNYIVDIRITLKFINFNEVNNFNERITEHFGKFDEKDIYLNFTKGFEILLTNKLVELFGGTLDFKIENDNSLVLILEFKKIKVSKSRPSIFDKIDNQPKYIFDKSKILLISNRKEFREQLIDYTSEYTDISLSVKFNFSDAIEILKNIKYDLIIIDLELLHNENHEDLNILKNQLYESKIPVIGCLDEILADTSYFDCIFSKTISKYEFIECIAKFLYHTENSSSDKLGNLMDSEINMLVAKNIFETIDKDVLIKFIEEFDEFHRDNLCSIMGYFDLDILRETINNFDKLTDKYGIESFTDINWKIIEASGNFEISIINECVETIFQSINYCKLNLGLK
jgi:PAS domain S-box-containing protein